MILGRRPRRSWCAALRTSRSWTVWRRVPRCCGEINPPRRARRLRGPGPSHVQADGADHNSANMGALLRLWRRQVSDLLASTGRLHLRLTVLNARLSYPRDDPRLVVGRELRQRVAFPVYLRRKSSHETDPVNPCSWRVMRRSFASLHNGYWAKQCDGCVQLSTRRRTIVRTGGWP